MLNYYELMNTVKDQLDGNALQTIQEAFNADFRKEYQNIHFNNTSRKNAVNSFLKNTDRVFVDKEHSYLWATQTAVIYSNSFYFTDEVTNGNETDVYNICKDWIKADNRRPVDFHFKESVAVARALGWTSGAAANGYKAYHIDIDGNIYDFNLVYMLSMMIADKDIRSGGVEYSLVKMDNSSRCALGMWSKYGMIFLLPTVSSLYSAYNVDFNYYMEHEKNIDNCIIGKVA